MQELKMLIYSQTIESSSITADIAVDFEESPFLIEEIWHLRKRYQNTSSTLKNNYEPILGSHKLTISDKNLLI